MIALTALSEPVALWMHHLTYPYDPSLILFPILYSSRMFTFFLSLMKSYTLIVKDSISSYTLSSMTCFYRKFFSLSLLNVFIWSTDASEFDSSNWTMFADSGILLFSSLKVVVLVFLRML